MIVRWVVNSYLESQSGTSFKHGIFIGEVEKAPKTTYWCHKPWSAKPYTPGGAIGLSPAHVCGHARNAQCDRVRGPSGRRNMERSQPSRSTFRTGSYKRNGYCRELSCNSCRLLLLEAEIGDQLIHCLPGRCRPAGRSCSASILCHVGNIQGACYH